MAFKEIRFDKANQFEISASKNRASLVPGYALSYWNIDIKQSCQFSSTMTNELY
jgi:hypothetical protein